MKVDIVKIMCAIVLVLGTAFWYGCSNKSISSDTVNTVSNSDTAKTSSNDDNVFTPVVSSVLAPPVPVMGSDGQFHLTYELNITNSNTFDWEIVSIEVLDGHPDGQVLEVVSGEEVMDKIQLLGTREPTNTLGPTQSGMVYLTFSVPSQEVIPDSLIHKLTVTVPGGLPEFITMFLELPQDQENISAYVAPVEVDKQEVFVFGPPFEGLGWVAVNGCCDSITHVRSNLAVNGKNVISQRYAIDWMKLDSDNRLYVGDPQALDSWEGYNQNILAVSDAQVVTVVDKFPDQVPFILPAAEGSITLEEIDGNHVILALPNGQFAFYAHLRPGSTTVKEGDFVTKGQVIGKLGNTGNTSAPHLHLHIMETASSLGSNGLPHVFEEYNLIGKTTDHSFFDEGLEDNTPFVDEETGTIAGNSIDVLPAQLPGAHSQDLPLNLSVVEFP